jgi:prepilin-type N-terminal cleavage/methylation domain-containing protein
MSIRRFIPTSERGDTLVEVLIAIAVITSVMGGAFVMTNRSLQGSRDAQERVNSTKLVESQIEQTKNLAATTPTAIFGTGVPSSFCINGAGAVVASTNAACLVDVTGAPSTAQPNFRLTATRSGNTFTFTSTWTSVRGNVSNNVVIKYRIYQ